MDWLSCTEILFFFFFSSRRRHTRSLCDWSSDVCSSDLHDGNFVMDVVELPDGTPTPGLAEFAAVNAPVVLALDAGALTVVNRHHTLSTAYLRFVAVVEDDGGPRSSVTLPVPPVPPGHSAA